MKDAKVTNWLAKRGKFDHALHKICTNGRVRTTLPRPSEISEKNARAYIGEAIFDTPFMIQSNAETMMKILETL